MPSYLNYKPGTIDYGHTRGEVPHVDFHLHNSCEIYFLISGDVNYFIEKKVYPIQYGDLFITNSQEIHKPSFLSSKTYERIIINFDPIIVQPFNHPDFDLLHCFMNRPRGEQNKINFHKSQLEEVNRLFLKIENANKNTSNGGDILKTAYFIELLVLINRAFISGQPVEEHPNVPEKLIPVLDFIENNLESDLSLDSLERDFFIDRFYLSRLFKQSTGVNIHKYIIFKRIARAKALLPQGYNVTDTCILSGFKDYSNFLRTFKKIVGVPPGTYKQNMTLPTPL
jgi:AraC-like DNA-binding protein